MPFKQVRVRSLISASLLSAIATTMVSTAVFAQVPSEQCIKAQADVLAAQAELKAAQLNLYFANERCGQIEDCLEPYRLAVQNKTAALGAAQNTAQQACAN